MEEWKEVATQMFHEYREQADRYGTFNENVRSFNLLYAGKADALLELLGRFGSKPEVLTEVKERESK